MSSIVAAVFKVTIGLLVDKGRDKAAEKLKDGDVTDQQFRTLIVREIDDIKSNLKGLSRKDLGASISSFKEGIALLYEVFDGARIRNSDEATQAACAEVFTLAQEMAMLKLTGLDESAKRKLSSAKERFKHAREKASEAFNNEALEPSDRILAMQYRLMATILETVENPEDAIAPCKVCIEELNSLSAVQKSFAVKLKKGIQEVRSLFGQKKRKEIISSVCQANRVIYDVMQTVRKDSFLWISAVDIGESKVDPLRDKRVAKVLSEQGMEHCYVPWSFGHEEEPNKLKRPSGIATNSSGHFIVGEYFAKNIKMFDPCGQYTQYFTIPNDDVETKLYILDVTADNMDHIYVLVKYIEKTGSERWLVYVFSNTAGLQHNFRVKEEKALGTSLGEGWERLTVTNSKVLVLSMSRVSVYDTTGQFVLLFGVGTLENASDITAASDGRLLVVEWNDSCVHIFNEDGVLLNQLELQGRYNFPRIIFHHASEHVVIAGKDASTGLLHVEMFTKDGKFVSSTQIHEERIRFIGGMTVTKNGRIAVLLRENDMIFKVLVI